MNPDRMTYDEVPEFVRALYGPHFNRFAAQLALPASRCPICQAQCTSPAGVLVHADQAHPDEEML